MVMGMQEARCNGGSSAVGNPISLHKKIRMHAPSVEGGLAGEGGEALLGEVAGGTAGLTNDD